MKLVIAEINFKYTYISVKDIDSDKEYFSQGEQAEKDIEFIDKYGEQEFLNYLDSSGYFD